MATFFEEDLAPHGYAKHLILKSHIEAWLAIFTQSNYNHLVYIDGFAGAGRYGDGPGKPGSPLVFLSSWKKHRLYKNFPETLVILIEKDDENREKLTAAVEEYQQEERLKIKIFGGDFTSLLEKELDERQLHRQPILAFLDPFGYTQIPMTIIRRLMSYGKTDILINFMTHGLRRGIGISVRNAGLKEKINALFGDTDDRVQKAFLELKHENSRDVTRRLKFLTGSYESALKKKGGANYTIYFAMKGPKNDLIYHLFFATRHLKGQIVMKNSMYRARCSNDEELSFSDRDYFRFEHTNLAVKARKEIWLEAAAKKLKEKYAGQRVSVEEVEHYIWAETIFPFRKSIVTRAEPHRIVNKDGTPCKRKGSAPAGSMITFRSI
ncbi:hypothetical protein BC938DRAFT_472676 [Jimgerdemannia flammicorona]|uniref:Three-Cys-motif partner protein TcmP n=1 Tax=Jimgerdemannia flammicorona TaxID=994334 RepID=A0A433QTW8_9FUNG|nr:hypothetical protein BC938DRAFT_472676 [Jimgerdemannia flammicorona]